MWVSVMDMLLCVVLWYRKLWTRLWNNSVNYKTMNIIVCTIDNWRSSHSKSIAGVEICRNFGHALSGSIIAWGSLKLMPALMLLTIGNMIMRRMALWFVSGDARTTIVHPEDARANSLAAQGYSLWAMQYWIHMTCTLIMYWRCWRASSKLRA